MTFNLVLDEPGESDIVEEHDGYQFIVGKNIYDDFGPFTLSSVKQGENVYLQLIAAKQPEENGGCGTCPSCG